QGVSCSLVSRHRQIRGEPWKARASQSKGSAQTRAAGITTSGADRVGPTRLRPVARAWKGSSLVRKPKCLHTYELLNSSRYRTGLGATGSEFFLEALRGVL